MLRMLGALTLAVLLAGCPTSSPPEPQVTRLPVDIVLENRGDAPLTLLLVVNESADRAPFPSEQATETPAANRTGDPLLETRVTLPPRANATWIATTHVTKPAVRVALYEESAPHTPGRLVFESIDPVQAPGVEFSFALEPGTGGELAVVSRGYTVCGQEAPCLRERAGG